MLWHSKSISLYLSVTVNTDETIQTQIARLMVDSRCRLHPDDVITSTGCQEALPTCLRTVIQPDDVVVDECMKKGVSIAPGVLFSASGKYYQCVRLNYSVKPSEENENAVRLIGERIHHLVS